MLTNSRGSIPIIFLVTDGAVEDERQICDAMKSRLTNGGSICPRIYTFGIGNIFSSFELGSSTLIALQTTFPFSYKNESWKSTVAGSYINSFSGIQIL